MESVTVMECDSTVVGYPNARDSPEIIRLTPSPPPIPPPAAPRNGASQPSGRAARPNVVGRPNGAARANEAVAHRPAPSPAHHNNQPQQQRPIEDYSRYATEYRASFPYESLINRTIAQSLPAVSNANVINQPRTHQQLSEQLFRMHPEMDPSTVPRSLSQQQLLDLLEMHRPQMDPTAAPRSPPPQPAAAAASVIASAAIPQLASSIPYEAPAAHANINPASYVPMNPYIGYYNQQQDQAVYNNNNEANQSNQGLSHVQEMAQQPYNPFQSGAAVSMVASRTIQHHRASSNRRVKSGKPESFARATRAMAAAAAAESKDKKQRKA